MASRATPPVCDDKAINATSTDVADSGPIHGWMKMTTLGRKAWRDRESGAPKTGLTISETRSSTRTADEGLFEVRSDDELLGGSDEHALGALTNGDGGRNVDTGGPTGEAQTQVVYKVYKRRWFGLVQLVLLNIIVSWDWLSFSAVSTSASQYYNVSSAAINWLSTSFLFAFVVMSPVTIYTLHRGGPKPSIIAAAVFILLGNWIRFGGTKANNFPAVMVGQIFTGLAQPFVLSAPTRYSDIWFTNRGRITATAVMSLANPFGGALGQLISPFWINTPDDMPSMVLYIAIISTVAALPAFFIPKAPPSPCSPSSRDTKQDLLPSLRVLFTSPEFYMIFIPFVFYVGLFNSISSLINQILAPFGFSETDAGIAGALLIVVGLIVSAITSPILDRIKKYLLAIKFQTPIIAICYLAFIWAPPTGTDAAPFVILSFLGAASFSLVPVALEFLIEITHPVSPEVTSTICWSGGQLLGGIFILISTPLTDGPNGGAGGSAPYNMQRVLWFQAIVAMVVVPLPLMLGCFGRQGKVRMRRVEVDKAPPADGQIAVGSVVLAET